VALTAVVLAGGARDALTAHDPGAPNKAFLDIAGTPLVARALAPLREIPRIGRIIAVAPGGARSASALAAADEIRPDGRRIADSLRSGVAGLDPTEPVLLVAGDLPVLSRAALDEFLDLALGRGADIAYACVEKRAHEARYPDVPHTWARLREGTYCGGGCVLLRPRALVPLEGFLDRLGDARKNPLRLAAIFGWDVVLRYAVGRLGIVDLERRASALLGVAVAAAVCTHPEIAVNVDRPSDVALAVKLVTGLNPRPTSSG
jgi:molybdopterin-guanine dinucleotide biosynthesis protein A